MRDRLSSTLAVPNASPISSWGAAQVMALLITVFSKAIETEIGIIATTNTGTFGLNAQPSIPTACSAQAAVITHAVAETFRQRTDQTDLDADGQQALVRHQVRSDRHAEPKLALGPQRKQRHEQGGGQGGKQSHDQERTQARLTHLLSNRCEVDQFPAALPCC